MVEESVQGKLAVAGGGITGLSAAYYALKQGVPGDRIDVYEGSNRLGGKIESATLDGKVVNKGAEFVDTDYHQFIGLCNELGVKLTDATDQQAMTMQRPGGGSMSEARFMREYQPLADIMLQHKAELAAQPYGALARRLDAMSVDQYVDALGAQVRGNVFQRLLHFVTFRPSVSPEILEMLKQSYVSEGCHAAERISALQFVHESGAKPGEFRVSDCAYRVEGGTEQLIHALRAKLEQAGVRIHTGSEVSSLAKTAGGVELRFADGRTATSEKVILGLPTYAISRIQGLDALGLAPQAQSLLANTQYTNAIKFTVKLKDGVTPEQSNFFSSTGFQSWPGQPGQLTFLCSADQMNGRSMPDFLRQTMDQYAKAYNTTAEALFDISGPGKIVLTNPGRSQCYASPAPGQAMQLEQLSGSMDRLAGNGVGIAGTFLPMHEKAGMGIGFMECGVTSARLTAEHLLAAEPVKTNWLARMQARQVAPSLATSAPGL